jgi:vacuolar-type H+-ATPase subunit D/Vma8
MRTLEEAEKKIKILEAQIKHLKMMIDAFDTQVIERAFSNGK